MKKGILLSFLILFLLSTGCKKDKPGEQGKQVTITDAIGRKVDLFLHPERVICSGPGSLRLLTYLQAQGRAVAVDSMEVKKQKFDARPYALVNKQFRKYPVFGEFRGEDNPEVILGLDPAPQVIFKTYPMMGTNPEKLQAKTGIPVVVLNYGDLGYYRKDLYQALTIMGKVLGLEERAREVIEFFTRTMDDLKKRAGEKKKGPGTSCYVGGIAYKGPHGFQSTEPAYPPFKMVNANNVAFDRKKSPKELAHADVAKEMIIRWDPELVFVDLSTLQSDAGANALNELRNDPLYRELGAVKKGNVYGLLPYNWYTRNFGSILGNAYYIGKILHPEAFSDIDPVKKTDEIYRFLIGKEVFREMNRQFGKMVFKKISVRKKK